MTDRFAEQMAHRDVAKDTRLLGDFAVIFCKGNHPDARRTALVSAGSELGVYGKRPPAVCAECADLLVYAEKRRVLCSKDPKPFCSHCDTHCYKPDMRERMRDVMRYAGPRSVLRGHAIDSVKHLIEGKRHARDAARTK